MKQRLLTILLTLLPLLASADAVEINGIYYNLITKGNIAEVTSNPNQYTGEILIPKSVFYEETEYDVTAIGENAFSCSRITSVTIPNSVTYIGNYAFFCCSEISSVNIPNGVTTIGDFAFNNCSQLYSMTIPNSVKSIGNNVFQDCSSLTSVIIGNGVEIIGALAFYDCNSLTSVTIGNNVKTIGHRSFWGCSSLTSIIIPNSVTSLGACAFSGCSSLTSVVIGSSLRSIDDSAFYKCTGLTSITIPNNVTTIGDYAFKDCTSLTSVFIPNSVSKIGMNCFEGCNGLKTVTLGSGLKILGSSAYANCPELTDVYCYAETVPSMINVYTYIPCIDAFQGSYIEYAILHVPESSIKAYETTEPWKNFKYIVKTMPRHTLTYMVDGVIYKSYQIEEDASITPETEPIKDGYSFSGWSEIPETMPANDVTITGTFTINKYKLIYQVDGVEYKTFEFEYGANITPEAEPTKEGYTFSGWSDIPETIPAHDVTVTGTFTINKYKLTYIVDGVEYKSFEIEYNSTITPEADPTKEGYTFSGWNEIPETMPANDVTVTGSFTINKYKLTYIVDGEEYKSIEVEYNSSITPEAEPTKDGYKFSGWTEIPETMPAHDVTITGSFERIDGPEQLAERTVLIYMAAQNNLSYWPGSGYRLAKSDLDEIKQAIPQLGDNHLVIFVDKAKDPNASYDDHNPYLLHYHKGELRDSIPMDPTSVPCDPTTMKNVITHAFTDYPAKDYGLVLWGHANGWQIKNDSIANYAARNRAYGGSNLNDSNIGAGDKWMNIPTLAKILKTLPHIKFIFADCCNMMCAECAYELKDVCDYYIGSTVEIPVKGAPYNTVVPAMMEKETFYQSICDNYASEYNNQLPLTVVKSSEMASLAAATKTILQEMKTKGLPDYPDMNDLIYYLDKNQYDMNHFLMKYATNYGIEAEYQSWKQAFDKAVIYKKFAKEWDTMNHVSFLEFDMTEENYGGLSMFIPQWKLQNTDNELIKKMGWYYAAGLENIFGSSIGNKYRLNYIIDGIVYKTYEIEYGKAITPDDAPTKEGYTFSGWSEIPATMPAEDVIVTGTFTVNQYILTYVVDGAVYKEYCYDYGSTIAPETEPTKEGYTFSGWSEIPETMPANEVYVVGKFTINKYKITYVIDGVVFKTEEVEYGSTITPPNPGDHEGYDFAWEDYPDTMPAEDILIYGTYTPTGIEAILASEPDVKIFTVSGKPLNKVQKGVNILRYKDGRTRKIVVK